MKTLLMLNDIVINKDNISKFVRLLKIVMFETEVDSRGIKILSSDTGITDLITEKKLKKIEVLNNITKAVETLGSIDVNQIIDNGNSSPYNSNIEIYNNKPTNLINKNAKIAIVDDDVSIRNLLSLSLQPLSNDISSFHNGIDFLKHLSNELPDLLMLDLMMPGLNGFELLEKLMLANITIPTIIFTALAKKEIVKKALEYKVKSYVIKPLTPDDIFQKVDEVLNSHF